MAKIVDKVLGKTGNQWIEFVKHGMVMMEDEKKFSLPENMVTVIDCETTGIDSTAEIIGIAMFNASTRQVLLNTLVKPVGSIPRKSWRYNGIGNRHVENAPTFKKLFPFINRILDRSSRVLTCCKDFDLLMFKQTREQYKGLKPTNWEKNHIETVEIFPKHLFRTYLRPYASDYSDHRWLRNVYEICSTKSGIYTYHGVFKPMFRYVNETGIDVYCLNTKFGYIPIQDFFNSYAAAYARQH